jgi:hypothetical protein
VGVGRQEGQAALDLGGGVGEISRTGLVLG